MSKWLGTTVLKYTIQWLFSGFTELCNSSLSSSKTFSSLQKETLHPGIIISYSLFPLSPDSHNLLSVFLDLPFLDISCKCNHIICGQFCLTSLTEHAVFKFIHIVACVSNSFLFMLNGILLYVYAIFFIHPFSI